MMLSTSATYTSGTASVATGASCHDAAVSAALRLNRRLAPRTRVVFTSPRGLYGLIPCTRPRAARDATTIPRSPAPRTLSDTDLRLRVFRLLLPRALDLDRAVFHQRDERADGRENRREHDTDDTCRQRKFGHDTALVLDDHTAGVAFAHELLHLLDDVFALRFERIPDGFGVHGISSGGHPMSVSPCSPYTKWARASISVSLPAACIDAARSSRRR